MIREWRGGEMQQKASKKQQRACKTAALGMVFGKQEQFRGIKKEN